MPPARRHDGVATRCRTPTRPGTGRLDRNQAEAISSKIGVVSPRSNALASGRDRAAGRPGRGTARAARTARRPGGRRAAARIAGSGTGPDALGLRRGNWPRGRHAGRHRAQPAARAHPPGSRSDAALAVGVLNGLLAAALEIAAELPRVRAGPAAGPPTRRRAARPGPTAGRSSTGRCAAGGRPAPGPGGWAPRTGELTGLRSSGSTGARTGRQAMSGCSPRTGRPPAGLPHGPARWSRAARRRRTGSAPAARRRTAPAGGPPVIVPVGGGALTGLVGRRSVGVRFVDRDVGDGEEPMPRRLGRNGPLLDARLVRDVGSSSAVSGASGPAHLPGRRGPAAAPWPAGRNLPGSVAAPADRAGSTGCRRPRRGPVGALVPGAPVPVRRAPGSGGGAPPPRPGPPCAGAPGKGRGPVGRGPSTPVSAGRGPPNGRSGIGAEPGSARSFKGRAPGPSDGLSPGRDDRSSSSTDRSSSPGCAGLPPPGDGDAARPEAPVSRSRRAAASWSSRACSRGDAALRHPR